MQFSLSEAPLSYSLLAVNILVSLYAFANRAFLEQNIFHMSSVLRDHQYHRLLSSGFLHGDPMHLLFNMFTLFFFGPALEYLMGTTKFAILYFGSLFGAKALTIFFNRKNPDYMSLGASGAISGLLLAFCLYAPMTMLYIFGLIPIPAFAFAGLFIAYSSVAMGGQGRTAHEAHLGGALAGIVLFMILTPNLVSFF